MLGYPIETVLAEKLVTAMDLGLANTRVRDYVDVHLLTNTQSMRCGTLRDALSATAEFRGTTLRPLAEAASGLGDLRASTYVAYRNGLGELGSAVPDTLSELIEVTAAFIGPVTNGLDVEATWLPAIREWRMP